MNRILRISEVSEKIGLSRSSIYERINPRSHRFDPTFPRPFHLGAPGTRAVGFNEGEIDEWIASLSKRRPDDRAAA